MLAPTTTSWPSTRISRRRAASSRWQSTSSSLTSSTPSSRTANSSPPSRATESTARTQPTSRAATILSSSSPSAWPNRSLTPLKPSRSRNRTASAEPLRWARCTACSTRSRNSVRLGSDVRASCRASRPISVAMASREKASSPTVASASSALRSASTVARARLTAGATSHMVRLPARTRAPISFGWRALVAQLDVARGHRGARVDPQQRLQLGRGLGHLRLRGGVEQRRQPSPVLASPGERAGRDQDREDRHGQQDARVRRQRPGTPGPPGSPGCRWRRRHRGRPGRRSGPAHR